MRTPEVKTVVQCRGLEKAYGKEAARIEALRGVDLELHRGQLLLLVGPSGCGKTTLLSILSGVLDQDAGECEVLGHRWLSMSESERVRFRGRTIGFVFQELHLLPALSAVENVAIPLLLAGRRWRAAMELAGGWLERVGLGERLDSVPGALSGGQRQRVAIARALVHDPELVVCDEPTSQLDAERGREVMELLRDLTHPRGREGSRSIVVVTHDTRILELADRVASMEDGRIVDERIVGSGGAA